MAASTRLLATRALASRGPRPAERSKRGSLGRHHPPLRGRLPQRVRVQPQAPQMRGRSHGQPLQAEGEEAEPEAGHQGGEDPGGQAVQRQVQVGVDPPSPQARRPVELRLTAFRCKLDDRRYRHCPGFQKGFRHVSRGEHVFKVFAIGDDGKRDPTPAKRRFHIPSPGLLRCAKSGTDAFHAKAEVVRSLPARSKHAKPIHRAATRLRTHRSGRRR
jgi:hypothetical protein